MKLVESSADIRRKKRVFFCVFAVAILCLSGIHIVMRSSKAMSMRYIMGFALEDCVRLVDFQLFLLLILSLVCFGVLYAVFFSRLKYELLFTLAAFGFGLIYLLSLTPLAVPDEATHFSTIYELSCRLPGCRGIADFGDMSGFANHDSVCNGYLRIMDQFGGASAASGLGKGDNPSVLSNMWTLVYVVEYVPQIIGVALAMLLGRNMVTAFLLGRFFNLAFYCLCVFLAVRRAPRFKLMFGFAGLMPMALQQAASLSYDSFVNALALILLSSILKAIFDESPLRLGDFLFIYVTAVILTPAKGVYAVFILLFFFVPKDKFPLMGKGKGFWASLLVLSCAGFFALISLPQMIRILGDTRPGFEVTGESQNTLAQALSDPIGTLRIFVDTFNIYILDWLGDAVGSDLGTYAIKVPGWLVPGYVGCLLLAVQNEREAAPSLPRGFKGCCVGASAFVILAFMLTMYFAWISTADRIIYGVQGRYFTPIIPLLLLATNGENIRVRHEAMDKWLCAIVMLLSARSLLEVISYTMQHALG